MDLFVQYQAEGRRYATADLSFDRVYWGTRGIESIIRLNEPTSIGHLFREGCSARHAFPTRIDAARYVAAKELAGRVPKGRILLAEELRHIIRSPNWRDAIQYVYLQGKARLLPGVDLSKGVCNRCGQSTAIAPIDCATCREVCAYCQRCLQMGRSKACAPLFAIDIENTDAPPEKYANALQWDGELTEAQRDASRLAIEVAKGTDERFLVWAVCGAGKTEVVFGPIATALEQGKTALVVTPRKDVVLELTPRLKRAFPDIPMNAIYGESKEKWTEAAITVSTTHQALRFYKKFDLVVLDEVDAFPYHGDPMLYFAVERAKKRAGNVIYLSATPPSTLRSIPHVRIPARYHRKPLAVPKLIIDKKCDRRVPYSLEKVIDRMMAEKRQAFVFVPYIDRVEELVNQLIKLRPDAQFEGVHASDPLRERKVSDFRKGKIHALVTTTIMERGVTVPRAEVIVLQADAPIFDEASLVQMSGRTGRSFDDPIGRVTFIAKEKTRAIVKAIKHIKGMNKLAKKKGLLDL